MSTVTALRSVVAMNEANLKAIKELKEDFDDYLTDWERNFLTTCEAWLSRSKSNSLSFKQQSCLDNLRVKISERMDEE